MDYMNYTPIQIMKKSERAEIYFAAVEGFERPVVVKRLKEATPEIYRKVAEIQSVHIPKVYHVEEQGDILLVVEEYIDGRTLGAYLKEEQPSDLQKMELMLQLCDALEVLHNCVPPVIHRDIKPSNILITTEGILKVIDFDAARQYNPEKNTSDTRLLGTIEYAAPEQFGYAQTDLRSDVYSLGVVFSEIKMAQDALYAKDWKRIVDKCTSFDPENRYGNVEELKKDVIKCLRKAKERRKIFCLPAVGITLIALLAVGTVLLLGNNDKETTNVPEIATTMTPTLTITPTSAPIMTVISTPEQPVKNIQTSLREAHGKRIVGEYTESLGCGIDSMDYVESEHVSYKVNDSGSAFLQFEENYGSIVFELPVLVDMTYCVNVMTRINTQVGNVTFVLYDEKGTVVDSFEIDKTEETREVFFTSTYKGKVAYVGYMANDMEVEDYSEFAVTVYNVDFFVIHPDTPKISYSMAELTEEGYYYCEYVRNDDGSVLIAYDEYQGKLKLRLPEEVDMRYCVGIGVVMESETRELKVNTYNNEFKHVETFRGFKTTGVEEKLLTHYSGIKVAGIGLMIDGPEPESFENCTATVYAINFYMEEGYQEKLSEPAENPENSKRVVGEHTEKVGYLISDLTYVNSYDVAYHSNDSGSVSLQFKRIYDEIFYELPDVIDMNYCTEMVVRLNSSVGEVGVRLYDESFTAVERFHIDKTEGTQEISLSPGYKGKVAYIGFCAMDGKLEDYSDFIATFHYVDFLVINPETPHISYEMADFTEEQYQGLRRRYLVDGSVYLELEQEQGELTLHFPEPVNLRYCTGIGVVMECEEGNLDIRLYDETFYEYGTFYHYTTNGVEEFFLDPALDKQAGGISLILNGMESDKFSDCDATVYAIKFYMEDKYWELPEPVSAEPEGWVISQKTGEVSYTMDELEFDDSERASYLPVEDSAVSVRYESIYGSLVYRLPEIMDMKNCTEFVTEIKNEVGDIVIAFHDANFNEVESFEPGITKGTEKISYKPRHGQQAAFIRFLAIDGEIPDYSDFETTVYSVTFYMEE